MSETLRTCPHCGLHAHQVMATPRIIADDDAGESDAWILDDSGYGFHTRGDAIVAADDRYGYESAWMWDQYVPDAEWQVALCAACKRLSLLRHGQLVFPAVAPGVEPPHPDMPEGAAELYREAGAVLAGSRRAAAALARASLESLLKEVDSTPERRRDLNVRVGELSDRITPALWKVLTVLRVVGNDALHGGDDELIAIYLQPEDADLAETFFSAINQLVDEVITRPRRAEELFAMIPEGKRASAERAMVGDDGQRA